MNDEGNVEAWEGEDDKDEGNFSSINDNETYIQRRLLICTGILQ